MPPPSAEFQRWVADFNRRHRFGIPVLPPLRKGVGTMPPTLVALPPRAGSMAWPDEDVAAVIDLLRQAAPGQAVRLTDEPDDSDNTARRRAELMKEQVEKVAATDVVGTESPTIKPGYKIRGHVLTAGEGTVKEHESKKSGKTYKITQYPKNWAAVSLVPDTPDNGTEPQSVTDAAAAAAAAESPAEPPAPPVEPTTPEPPAGRQTRRRG